MESWKGLTDGPVAPVEPQFEEILRLTLPEPARVPVGLKDLLAATPSDLPMTVNERVLRYVNYFLGRGRKSLQASHGRAGAYRAMISRVLAEQRVPQDLIYLVQAESGFRPQVKSSKKATGMWQFVAWRGREYGLSQNRQVDERMDPEKATYAAAQHLADLHAQFGDWYLAMAAYNCGPGCVQRAVERTGYADYWELAARGALPRETANFVPAILALALLGKNAEAVQLDQVVPEEPIEYGTVRIASAMSIDLIADATASTAEHIRRLNPALLGPVTPSGPYSLRIPANTGDRFEREIAVVPEAHRRTWRRYEVGPGETLARIAARYRVTPLQIAAVNRLGPEGPGAGDRLTIPVAGRSSAVASTGVRRYRVRAGDTLGELARRYRVSVSQLQRWNGITGTRLETGQVLTIRAQPGSSPRPRAVAGGGPAKDTPAGLAAGSGPEGS